MPINPETFDQYRDIAGLGNSCLSAIDFSSGCKHGEFDDLKIQLVADVRSTEACYQRRLLVGHLLGVVGDPRLDESECKMVDIPAGTATLGWNEQQLRLVGKMFADLNLDPKWLEKSVPQHQQTLPAFRLSRFPVTNREYAVFLREDRAADAPTAWPGGIYPPELSNHPVASVSIVSAKAYCEWLSTREGRRYRLLTEVEWEYAATGAEGCLFPWGDEFAPDRANTSEQRSLRTTPVGIFPSGTSPFGLHDMGGNVEEWTNSIYAAYPGGKLVKDWFYENDNAHHVTRGGSFNLHRDLAACQRRHAAGPYAEVGFRVAETV